MLTPMQMRRTRKELEENFNNSMATKEELSEMLDMSIEKIDQLFKLKTNNYVEVWYLRNAIRTILNEKNIEHVPYSALKGEIEDYWFYRRIDEKIYDNRR